MQQTRIELEISVAACVLLDNGANVFHVDLELEDFEYAPARAVIGAAKESSPIDLLLVRTWANNNGIPVTAADLSAMINAVPTTKHFLHYLVKLKSLIYQAGIETLRREVQQRSKNEDLLELAREIAERESELAGKYLENEQIGDLTEASAAVINRIEARLDNDDLFVTNFDVFDELQGGGSMPNELIVIAARPSIGKTAFMLQIAAGSRKKGVIFSLEMNKSKISTRLLASVSLQNTKIASRQPSQVPDAIRNSLLESSWELMQISERLLVYDQADQTAESIRRIARKEVEDGAEFIGIDYLQLVNCKGDTREQAIAQVSRSMKNMTKELNVPVFLLAQLSRACESEKRPPKLSDLRESGAIEQDADSVILLHDSGTKTDDGHKKVYVIQAKGRDIGIGARMTVFNADHQRFYRLSNQEEPK